MTSFPSLTINEMWLNAAPFGTAPFFEMTPFFLRAGHDFFDFVGVSQGFWRNDRPRRICLKCGRRAWVIFRESRQLNAKKSRSETGFSLRERPKDWGWQSQLLLSDYKEAGSTDEIHAGEGIGATRISGNVFKGCSAIIVGRPSGRIAVESSGAS